MKYLALILVCIGFCSCLKDTLPLERNDGFEKINEVKDWISFSDTSKVYHPFYPGYYELTIQFEITDPFLKSNDVIYTVSGVNLNNGKVINCNPKIVGDKLVFSNTLFVLQNTGKERCYEFFFNVVNGSENYGLTKICKVL